MNAFVLIWAVRVAVGVIVVGALVEALLNPGRRAPDGARLRHRDDDPLSADGWRN